jgi:hypothetical protein
MNTIGEMLSTAVFMGRRDKPGDDEYGFISTPTEKSLVGALVIQDSLT